jgi:uncharacterized protein
MKSFVKAIWTLAGSLLLLSAAGAVGSPLQIAWGDLKPGNQAGETLSWELQGKQIELVGYVLPVDRDGELVYEFLLLPLTGVCSHVPPPAANQIVHVIPARPYRLAEIYEPVAITGMLKPGLEKTQLFVLDGVTVIESGYSVGRAEVAKTEKVPNAQSQGGAMPWSFLEK